jgi:5-methylcytosine-specific restriction endonuclease McrA
MKSKYELQYGECSLCGKVGTMQYHHIIPKRLCIKTKIRPKLYYEIENNKTVEIQVSKKSRIEKIQLKVCEDCHKILHPENITKSKEPQRK